MKQVLIVDDEAQIRKGLQWKINWEQEGFKIVGEAANGESALKLIKDMEVDLILTDVRMPIMDGVELAKRCHEEFPNIKIIMLSGYSDFEHVKNAMKEGVKDYLLKPVDVDELSDVLKRMKKEIQIEKEKQLELKEIQRLVRSQMQEAQEQFLLYLAKEEWFQPKMVKERLKQLQLDRLLNDNVKPQFVTVEIRDIIENHSRVKELNKPFQTLCKEIANNHRDVFSFYDPNHANMVHFLILFDPDTPNKIDTLIKNVQFNVNKLFKLKTVIGIGNVVKGLENLKTGYISSLLSWSQSQLGAYSQVIDNNKKIEEIVDFSPELERKITNAIESTDMDRFEELLESLLGEINKQSILSFSIIANRILFSLSSLAKKYNLETIEIQGVIWESQQAIWELNSQSKVMEQLCHLAKLVMNSVTKIRLTDGKLIVESVKKYLDQHYGNDISLTTLSEIFHINSTYLSEIFKNQMEQNFSDYLVGLRISEAKKYLMDQQLKIIDVANLVGFSSSAYFSTVFKKQVGKTPVEYRNNQ